MSRLQKKLWSNEGRFSKLTKSLPPWSWPIARGQPWDVPHIAPCPKLHSQKLPFYLFFLACNPNPKEIGERYLQRHPSFSCWGQSNRMNKIAEIVPERAASVPLPAALSPPPEAGTQRIMLGHNFETYTILQANPFRCCLCWWPCCPSDPRSLELLSAGLPVSLHTLPQSAQGRRYAMDIKWITLA